MSQRAESERDSGQSRQVNAAGPTVDVNLRGGDVDAIAPMSVSPNRIILDLESVLLRPDLCLRDPSGKKVPNVVIPSAVAQSCTGPYLYPYRELLLFAESRGYVIVAGSAV